MIIAVRTVLTVLLLLASPPTTTSDKWQERVQVYLDAYEQSASAPKPIVYPELAERVRLQFPRNHSIHVSWSTVQTDGKEIRGELYSCPGALFVVQQDEGWNLVTEGEYVYEWQPGQASGIRIKKNVDDLVDYALYLTDPALLMTSLYYEFLSNSGVFASPPIEEGGLVRLQMKESREGIESLLVVRKPLWFRGYSFRIPASKVRGEFRVSTPQEVQSIPTWVTSLPTGIRFTDSDNTLQRHLDYL
jgi:hypothetical protein